MKIMKIKITKTKINEATKLNTRAARDLYKVKRELARSVQSKSSMFPESVQVIMDLCDQIKEIAAQLNSPSTPTGSD